jgi:predicted Zn-ribbon and HTH transcriptional regulator
MSGTEHKCLHCGHHWRQRKPEYGKPRECPHCKNPRWDQPLRYSPAKTEKTKPQMAGISETVSVT